MTTEQTHTEEPVWGAPVASAKRWGMRETAVAVGVAAVIAALGGAAIYAATEGSSHPMGARNTFAGAGQHSGPMGGPGGQTGTGPAPLHGEFVVPDGAGAYTTELTQTGTVTAVSANNITVRSEDGFSQTYVVPQSSDGATPAVAVNDDVTIRATRTGQTVTVTDIGKPQPGGGPAGPPHRN
jgi:hypothetical protein